MNSNPKPRVKPRRRPRIEISRRTSAHQDASPQLKTDTYFERWLEIFVRPNRSYSTHRQYRQVWKNYLKPTLGHLELCDLSSDACQRALNLVLERRSARTAELSRTILVKALGDAVKQGHLDSNPAAATYRPRAAAPQLRALRKSESARLLGVLGEDVNGQLIRFLLATGLRISEALGLRWNDYEEELAEIHVAKRLQWETKGKYRLAPLKTAKSRRSVPLSSLALDVLTKRKSDICCENTLVFVSARGRPLHPRNVQRYLDAKLKKAGLCHYSLHDLRRTFATTMALQGTPVHIVQAVMGHESVLTTLNHYSCHFREDLRRAVHSVHYAEEMRS